MKFIALLIFTNIKIIYFVFIFRHFIFIFVVSFYFFLTFVFRSYFQNLHFYLLLIIYLFLQYTHYFNIKFIRISMIFFNRINQNKIFFGTNQNKNQINKNFDSFSNFDFYSNCEFFSKFEKKCENRNQAISTKKIVQNKSSSKQLNSESDFTFSNSKFKFQFF